jgi:hypothetical protein
LSPFENYTTGQSLFDETSDALVYHREGAAGWEEIFAGRPTATWRPEALTGLGFGIGSGGFAFNTTYANGATLIIEACTNLANADWSAIETNTVSGGLSYFSDGQWMNSANRFYRIRALE